MSARVDTSRQCCDGRCQQGRDCPLQPRSLVPPQEVYDFCQAKPRRPGRTLFTAVVAIALIAVGVLLLVAPISTTQAVAFFVGQR